MIEESGVVVDVNQEGIWVETVKQSACASCAARNGCGQKLLASAGAGKRFIFKVSNPQNIVVHADDRVVVGIQEGAFIKATLFMYLAPLIALFVGAFSAELMGLSEGIVILSAVVSLVASLLCVRFSSRSLFRSCQYQPKLVKVS